MAPESTPTQRPVAPTALILSGGVAHDFPALSDRLAGLLAQVGVTAEIRTDVEAAVDDLAPYDLLVVNMLRWRMLGGRYGAERGRWGLALGEPARQRIEEWVRGGGGLLAMHASSICFDDWPGWTSLVGARWDWEISRHPPVGRVRVTVYPDRHPLVAGLPAQFDTDDEVYGFLDLAEDVVPLLTAEHSGAVHPLLWARTVGAGRVVHTTLGHHLPSYRAAPVQRIVRRAALWARGEPDDVVARA